MLNDFYPDLTSESNPALSAFFVVLLKQVFFFFNFKFLFLSVSILCKQCEQVKSKGLYVGKRLLSVWKAKNKAQFFHDPLKKH